jgi:putative salt-induced outer membrane protein YdiY
MVALFLVLAAHAEEPTFAKAKPVTHLAATLGGTFATGNAESLVVNGGLTATHHWLRNELGLTAALNEGIGAVDANADGFLSASERCFGSAPCAKTAERYTSDLRYDRFLSDRDSLYAIAGALHDPFLGFAHREHGQLGYAYRLIDTNVDHLKAELGADVANEQYVAGMAPAWTRLLAAQLGLQYTHTFNQAVAFSDALTIYEPVYTQPEGDPFAPHLTDVRLTNEASITAKVADSLALRLTDTLGWRNEPAPAPEGITETRAALDNTVSITLVASLL